MEEEPPKKRAKRRAPEPVWVVNVKVLGIIDGAHDSGACLVQDGTIVAAVGEERPHASQVDRGVSEGIHSFGPGDRGHGAGRRGPGGGGERAHSPDLLPHVPSPAEDCPSRWRALRNHRGLVADAGRGLHPVPIRGDGADSRQPGGTHGSAPHARPGATRSPRLAEIEARPLRRAPSFPRGRRLLHQWQGNGALHHLRRHRRRHGPGGIPGIAGTHAAPARRGLSRFPGASLRHGDGFCRVRPLSPRGQVDRTRSLRERAGRRRPLSLRAPRRGHGVHWPLGTGREPVLPQAHGPPPRGRRRVAPGRRGRTPGGPGGGVGGKGRGPRSLSLRWGLCQRATQSPHPCLWTGRFRVRVPSHGRRRTLRRRSAPRVGRGDRAPRSGAHAPRPRARLPGARIRRIPHGTGPAGCPPRVPPLAGHRARGGRTRGRGPHRGTSCGTHGVRSTRPGQPLHPLQRRQPRRQGDLEPQAAAHRVHALRPPAPGRRMPPPATGAWRERSTRPSS